MREQEQEGESERGGDGGGGMIQKRKLRKQGASGQKMSAPFEQGRAKACVLTPCIGAWYHPRHIAHGGMALARLPQDYDTDFPGHATRPFFLFQVIA